MTDTHWQREPARISTRDSRRDRYLASDNCYICHSDTWVGTLSCLHCNCPIIHEGFFPSYKHDDVSFSRDRTEPVDEEIVKKLKAVVARGRRATGMRFNVMFGVRMPDIDEESRKAQLYTRSMRKQAERTDKDLLRSFNAFRRFGTVRYNTLEEQIQNDAKYRMKLARKMVNCTANFAPASILLSKYMRMAFELTIQNGEMSYSKLRKRSRRETREPE